MKSELNDEDNTSCCLMSMNSALFSYTELTDIFCKLCQASAREDFVSGVAVLVNVLKKVEDFRLFPINVDITVVSALKDDCKEWVNERNEFCRQLYVELATLMYRFEASNIRNRAYFDYMLELGRTSLPYEVTNEWGKEYVQDLQFSHEGFFFAINRDTRFLHKTKQEYNDYCIALREREVLDRPVEKVISVSLMKELSACYNNYYNTYCDSIERLYPEIKGLFLLYNLHMRIYLCSYDTSGDNPKIDFVLAYFYPSNKREVTVYPNYVDFAYRFYNIEEMEDNIVTGHLCAYEYGKGIFNLVDPISIYHDVNFLFVQNASWEILSDYVCYFLRGQGKKLKVTGSNLLQYSGKTIVFCDYETSLSQIEASYQSIITPHFIFFAYPAEPIVKYLKDNDILWSCIFHYGQNMINNDNAQMVHWFIRDHINVLKGLHINKGGDFIEQKLTKCKCGRLCWHDYELIGTEIFNYLFSDDFVDYQFKYQSKTNDKTLRRDLVVNNNFKDKSSFWAKMQDRYHCNMIIVDFKNYNEAIDSKCIYDVTKYMTSCTGNFVLIFSRFGVNESAKVEQLRMLREGQLVLCLSDSNLIEMIQRKQSGKSPHIVLDQLYFTLLQGV